MKAISLAANERTLTKTTGNKKIRSAGRVPGVLYGEGDPQNIELESVQFEKAVKSSSAKNFLVELEIDGTKSMALVQDVQKHPITRLCIHVDFRRLTDDSVITAKVPLIATGTAASRSVVFCRRFSTPSPSRANRPTFQRQSRWTPVTCKWEKAFCSKS